MVQLKDAKRQKNQLQQSLAFPETGKSEAPGSCGGGTESSMVKHMSESPASSEQLMEEICQAENCQQALVRVKANKRSPGIAVAQPQDRKFLGFSFTGSKAPRRRIAPKAILRFKERIRELTCRTRGISMEQRAKDLSTYLRGWRGYFGFCPTPSILYRLDQWLRRRLRSALGKQWKQGRTRFAELRQRGIGRDLAAQTAGSPHGPWRIANSPALGFALPNSYFDSLGLLRLSGMR